MNKFFIHKRKHKIWRKFWEWLNRYGPAEVSGTVIAVLGATLVHQLTDSTVASAYAGSICETLGFYSVMVSSEFRRYAKKRSKWHVTKNLFLEFGPSEVLDSFVTRPLFMGLGIYYLGQGWGLIAGKIAADMVFYVPSIIIYEWLKK